jgi:very-short-patch-repair endonuclease
MDIEKGYNENLHKGAKPVIYRNARELRHTETEAEKKLWPFLRNRKLNGKKFRRQHPMDDYVLDYYCHECRLAIEVDGGIHNDKMNSQYDEARTKTLNELGIKVIRVRNEDVLNNIDRVLQKIVKHLT